MQLPAADSVPILSEPDVVAARQAVRRLTQQLGFSLVDQTKFVTAASELARNALIYGGGGRMQWEILTNGPRNGLRLSFIDEGPGIPNLELAMQDGYSTGNSLGLGLPGSRRLMDEFEIDSEIGSGTTITMKKWVR